MSFFQAMMLLEEPIFKPRYLNMEYIFNKVLQFLQWLNEFFFSTLPGFIENIPEFLGFMYLYFIGWVLIALFAFGSGYSLYKILNLKHEERKKFWEAEMSSLEAFDHTEHNIRWKKVLDQLGMPNESDWRVAIIEADNILGDMLLKMRYVGDTIGEKLKSIEPSDFLTLPHAWEAHKMRNRIAHEGAEFRLSHRESQRIIELYKKVFEEFHYI